MVKKDKNELNSVKGAVYIPARAFNAPQMWKHYSSRETERDMGFAASIGLNGLRVWVSWEYWREAAEHFETNFNDFLEKTSARGIGILVSLFENCGVPPTDENMWTTDPCKAFAINSPHKEEIVAVPDRWNEPQKFVEWFMERYRDDDRLLAIELMNEPRQVDGLRFARAMFRTAAAMRGDVPLTIGACNLIDNMYFMEFGLDILQFHKNFPPSEDEMRKTIEQAVKVGDVLDKPVWLTEWQRIRRSGSGFGKKQVTDEELSPNYATLFSIVHSCEIGAFFWSLMVKPAYLGGQRRKGTYNGLFWEDGAVWSLADARAISGNPALQLEERPEWPDWGPPQNWRG